MRTTAKITIVTYHEGDQQGLSIEHPEGTWAGAALAGTGLAAFIIWQFVLRLIIWAGSENIYNECLRVTSGRLLNIDRSVFPTQIYCDTEAGPHAAALYSFWQSVGLSSVIVILVLIMFYGVWMMVRRDTNAPQARTSSTNRTRSQVRSISSI